MRRLPLTPDQQKAVMGLCGVSQSVLAKYLRGGECSVLVTWAVGRALADLGIENPAVTPGKVIDLARRVS
jgi:hypothetical protein